MTLVSAANHSAQAGGDKKTDGDKKTTDQKTGGDKGDKGKPDEKKPEQKKPKEKKRGEKSRTAQDGDWRRDKLPFTAFDPKSKPFYRNRRPKPSKT